MTVKPRRRCSSTVTITTKSDDDNSSGARDVKRAAPDTSRTEPETSRPSPAPAPTTAFYQFLDLGGVLLRLFGGCCSNVWSYEELLRLNPRIGSALTFSQMVFIASQALPHFLSRQEGSVFPKMQKPRVPLALWATQVIVLTTGSLLNNWVYRYHIPLTVQIVFRSAGLAVSMLFGRLVRGKSYTLGQVLSVLLVSAGVLLSAFSKPGGSGSASPEDATEYAIGLTMLVASLVLTGLLGTMQEQTYEKYGPVWREGMFYTHALSLPIFLFLIDDIKLGFNGLIAHSRSLVSPSSADPTDYFDAKHYTHLLPYAILLGNLVTQSICVSGVNQLTSRVSSVSTNLALTVRKALSLCLSVWWFGSGWNASFAAGASFVFSGSLLYALISRPPVPKKEKTA